VKAVDTFKFGVRSVPFGILGTVEVRFVPAGGSVLFSDVQYKYDNGEWQSLPVSFSEYPLARSFPKEKI